MFIDQNVNMQKGDLLGNFKSQTIDFVVYSLKLIPLLIDSHIVTEI